MKSDFENFGVRFFHAPKRPDTPNFVAIPENILVNIDKNHKN